MNGSRVVYVVHHQNPDTEDVKLIGVFSSQKHAMAAITKLSLVKGFANYKEFFHTDKYTINEINWSEGFITVED